MSCQFIFKAGLSRWRSYTFFNECSLCTLYSSKEIPIAAILLNAAIYILRHRWFSNRQKEAAALKIKATASKARENVSALRWLFFFAVVRQNEVIFFTYILYGKFVDFIKIRKNNERYRSIAL